MVIQYIRIMNNVNLGRNGFILFIVGLGVSLGSVYIENAIDGQYGSNPKIAGMLLNNVGIAIMAAGTVLLSISISKNKNIK